MPSRTALVAAFVRAYHHRHDHPKILDDPFAELLLTPAGMNAIEKSLAARAAEEAPESRSRGARVVHGLHYVPAAAGILARARYAEDRLLEALDRGVAQYVLVGA